MKSKQTKIWVVSELFYPETISTGYIMSEITKSLYNEFEVEVICGSLFYEHNGNNENFIDLPFLVNRINAVNYNKNHFISRLIGNLKISWKMFLLMKQKIPSNSQVLMVSNPIFLTWLASLLTKKRGWKIKLLVHDVFPENLSSIKRINLIGSLFLPLLKYFFDVAFSKMDTLILLGRDMKDVFLKKVNNVQIQIIENWADVQNISPRHNYSNHEFKFIYAGNFGRVQGIEALLESFNYIKNPKFSFIFIGSGARQNLIDDFIKKSKNNLIKRLPWQEREKQNGFLNDASIGVVSLAKGMYGLGVPSKFYNLLAAGKPILYIGPKNSELHLVINEFKIGWFVEADNVSEITDTFEKIINTSESILREYSSNARMLAETMYSKKIILSKFNKLFSHENIN